MNRKARAEEGCEKPARRLGVSYRPFLEETYDLQASFHWLGWLHQCMLRNPLAGSTHRVWIGCISVPTLKACELWDLKYAWQCTSMRGVLGSGTRVLAVDGIRHGIVSMGPLGLS